MNYSLRRVCRIVRLSPSVVASLVEAGVVAPARGARGAFEFSFRDLSVLRGLAQAHPGALKRGALRLRAAGGRRLVARAARPVVLEPDGTAWDAESGQLLIDFEADRAAAACVLEIGEGGESGPPSLLDEAIDLESRDPAAAMQAYRQVIAAEPTREDAYLSLGALLEERNELARALQVYRDGAAYCPQSSLLRFNCGVAFQLLSAYRDAEECYLAALALDPTLADAHHNLSLIYLELGDEQRAIRHHNEVRRLERG
ncbi:MAG TPA: tetratricopeptide repeat protein [Burkholderiaceae bacterium]|nr:tetratricopeptide repeat protein [Burkholderiaceae bacterium]